MANRKYLLLTGMICLLASYSFSQRVGGGFDVKDSSLVPSKRMPQHTEFLNGTYNFPSKPRNQWELGIKTGLLNVSGDIPSQLAFPSFGLHVRKAFGYIFSMRLEYMYGTGKGRTFNPAENFGKNSAWSYPGGYSAVWRNNAGQIVSWQQQFGGNPATPVEVVYYNYKTHVQDLSLQGVITLNNVRFHKAKTGFNFYGFVGIGGSVYDTKVNTLNSNGSKYNFSSITPNGVYKSRKDTYKALKSLLDDSYETPAQNQGPRRPKLFGNTFKPSGTLGAGVAFKLSNRVNLAIEDRQTFVKDDLLDGQQWQEHPYGDASLTSDFDSYNFVSVGLNINLGAKSVEPLWWLNPLDYAYSEIRNPRLMRLPKPVLPDSDGDGITDQFDQEQTPQGCPVDAHGITKDTDGDGVPDCKDKELITPTYCQPSDADGIGKCPCPDDCKVMAPPAASCSEKLGALPSVSFKAGSNRLSDDAKAVLASVASRLRNNPDCRVVVVGYCSSTKKEQQLSWDHVNAVINYMVEKEGVSVDRFIFNYGQDGGDCNIVDLRAAAEGENGPNTVPAPHPNLRKN
ncbi:MAG: OmpA family protein [Bacteroidia bacterium]|nr:OmpA family protein [Bacteroidia bacterium]